MDLEQAKAAVQRAAEAQREAERHLDLLSALVDRMNSGCVEVNHEALRKLSI